MSKLQKLQQELRYADKAKVSTAQLKQRLNDIIARTADADATYITENEQNYIPTYNTLAQGPINWNGYWVHKEFQVQPTTRLVKIINNPLTGETQRQNDPFGRRPWWQGPNDGREHFAYRDQSRWGPGDLNFTTVSNIPDLNPYHQSKASAASVRENLISELMNSKEFKAVHHLTNLRIVPEERKKEFRPRQYDRRKLTTKSDPRLLVNMVNNLRQAMQRRGTSSAPIGRFGGDFFANILKRGE